MTQRLVSFLSSLPLLLLPLFAFAQESAKAVEGEATYPVGAVIFIVLFLAMCVGFVIMVFRADKKPRESEVLESHKEPE